MPSNRTRNMINFKENSTSTIKIGQAKTAAETGFASPILNVQVLFW